MADTIAETVDLLYTIDQEKLDINQQIALGTALATLAQAERLDQINERLRTIHLLLTTMTHRSGVDGVR
ncbi:hypothetical protein ACN26Z_04130 [Verrucosispora sp. WMMD703]|uniref:Uncharacterized protein n=1 Tax=Micromonospora sediminimaris TaxID=547162 RepID=A0A9W5US30_9ACTN|nr:MULTISPECIES: hypothetical protein [Micromonospora]MBQ1049614.1 hypothetical protein [Micromonospora sp. C51]WBB56153.1 hypothetical protein O7601_08830 [Verrucosispora sp. WMMD573]WFE45360.1 hypothetical protein O7624_13860 [Verrucosispora sp. WMMD1129]SFC81139.1 hypothetical protein SAMN05216284_107249 [Micromonospora sediminimaris]GIJ33388.1 hypothetical protein Vse01_25360 [Micromonospora sediminimaris]